MKLLYDTIYPPVKPTSSHGLLRLYMYDDGSNPDLHGTRPPTISTTL
jgi:hypothetical protein